MANKECRELPVRIINFIEGDCVRLSSVLPGGPRQMGRDPEQPGGGGGGGQREQEGQHQHGHREGEGERPAQLRQGGEQVSQSAVSPREGQAYQEGGRQDPVLGNQLYVMFTCRHGHCRT